VRTSGLVEPLSRNPPETVDVMPVYFFFEAGAPGRLVVGDAYHARDVLRVEVLLGQRADLVASQTPLARGRNQSDANGHQQQWKHDLLSSLRSSHEDRSQILASLPLS